MSDYLDPRWQEAGKTHDWRNHVPENIQQIWETFSPTQQYELYLWAQDLAGREEWE